MASRGGVRYTSEQSFVTWWRQTRHTDSGCWEWTGLRSKNGAYGEVGFRGGAFKLHRAAYILFFGEIPNGYHIHHTCGNRLCWRPDHLEPMQQGLHNGRHKSERPTCRRGHPWTPENTSATVRQRVCKECKREERRHRRERIKQAATPIQK